MMRWMVGVCLAFCWLAAAAEDPAAAAARLVAATSDVVGFPADGTAPFTVVAGDAIALGQALEVGAEGGARVRLHNGLIVDMGPDSLIVIAEQHTATSHDGDVQGASGLGVRLQHGQIRLDADAVEGADTVFRASVPGAQMFTRHAEFGLRVDHVESIWVDVDQGAVLVAAQGETYTVDAGNAMVIHAGELPSDVQPRLPAPDMAVSAVGQSVTLAWPAQVDAVSYWLEVWSRTDDVLISQHLSLLDTLSLSLPFGDYRFRLSAVDEQGIRGQFAHQSLDVRPVPQPPAPTLPDDEPAIAAPSEAADSEESSDRRGLMLFLATAALLLLL